MTDGKKGIVYICDSIPDLLEEKVIAHELVHCIMFSYGIQGDIEQEEFIADWFATYGRELVYLLDEILYSLKIA